MARRGCVIVNMHFRVPVDVEFYKTACNKEVHEVTGQDIVDIEIENFSANPESFQEMLAVHLDSLTFDFEEVSDG